MKEEEKYYGTDYLHCPQEIRDAVEHIFHPSEEVEERVYLVCLNTRMKPVGFFEVSHGSENWAYFDLAQIFQRALLCGARNIVLAHNHPSGDVTPSEPDWQTTKQVYDAGKILGINLLDHIIMGEDHCYYSFNEEGLVGKEQCHV